MSNQRSTLPWHLSAPASQGLSRLACQYAAFLRVISWLISLSFFLLDAERIWLKMKPLWKQWWKIFTNGSYLRICLTKNSLSWLAAIGTWKSSSHVNSFIPDRSYLLISSHGSILKWLELCYFSACSGSDVRKKRPDNLYTLLLPRFLLNRLVFTLVIYRTCCPMPIWSSRADYTVVLVCRKPWKFDISSKGFWPLITLCFSFVSVLSPSDDCRNIAAVVRFLGLQQNSQWRLTSFLED